MFCAQERKKDGRPKLLDEYAVDKLVALLDHMVVQADGRYEVTVDMLRKRSRSKAGCRTISDALHARKIYFRPLRQKPVLTDDDIKAREKFAKMFKGRPAAWWNTHIDMHIDVKHFPVYLNGKARHHAAREGLRGAYRSKAKGLEAPYVQHSKRLKYNPGARGVMILAGVGNGKVLLWEMIDGRNWNGEVAAEFYKGAIKSALTRSRPWKRQWRVLEDNDPAGFKCKKAWPLGFVAP